jgi:hypothetical protein
MTNNFQDREKQWTEDINVMAARLSPTEQQAFERAKQQGFLDTSRRKSVLYRLYRNWCSCTGRPYIIVRKNSHYAEIRLDMYTVEWNLLPETQKAIHALLCNTALDHPRKEVYTSAATAGSDTVGLDRVEEVATRLFALATDPAIETAYRQAMEEAGYTLA